jgi:hypothetical protein
MQGTHRVYWTLHPPPQDNSLAVLYAYDPPHKIRFSPAFIYPTSPHHCLRNVATPAPHLLG